MDVTTICSVCLACTALVIVLDILRMAVADRRAHVTDLLWAAVFVGVQIFVFAWGAQGLLAQGEGSELMAGALAANAACLLAAHLACSRRRIARGMRGISGPGEEAAYRAASLPIDVLTLLVAGALSTLALELPHSSDLSQLAPVTLFLEWALVSASLVALYFVGQRRGFLAALEPVTCVGFGIAEYFVFLFKNQPLQPGDLFAVGTAATVADSYTYVLSASCLCAIAAAVGALALLCLVSHSKLALDASVAGPEAGHSVNAGDGEGAAPAPTVPAVSFRRPAAALANLTVGLALVALIVGHVTGVDFSSEYSVEVSAWDICGSYNKQAYIPTFIAEFQIMIPSVPEGYSVEAAEDLIARRAALYDSDSSLGASESRAAAVQQYEQEEKPCVIAVMNETFSDLSIFDWMDPAYEGPTYFKSIGDCLQRGVLYVSVNGGGTTNSEFEFLTGNSMANLGAGVYPYNSYNMSHTTNLAAQFKDLGYDTLAIHPYYPQNWNRTNVYETFGFDRFVSLDEFADAENFRGHVSDLATYERILDELETNSNPQLIFDITMQNHSGYETGLVPEDEQVSYSIGGGDADPLINEYLESVNRSDRALAEFLAHLSELDRKVVVVFFGDHQPYMTTSYNNEFDADEEGDEHQQRIYQTDYIIWANYDVAGNDRASEVVDLDASSLGATFMELIGAPLNDYQKARLTLRDALPVIDAAGYQDAYGIWHYPSETCDVEETEAVREDFRVMEFYNLFGDGTGIFEHQMQDGANA